MYYLWSNIYISFIPNVEMFNPKICATITVNYYYNVYVLHNITTKLNETSKKSIWYWVKEDEL